MVSPWQIWIDTGGTFTDCIGVAPDGVEHRLKILSNSVLRGKIARKVDPLTFVAEIQWPVKQDLFKDFQIRIVGNSTSVGIDRVDILNNRIHLQQPLLKYVEGSLFEITSGEEVPVLAARLLTKTPLGRKFPPLEMKLGSTRGTNAILERKGARTAFVVTRGFRDLLLIGNQQRPDLFTVNIIKPRPLYDFVFEVAERIGPDGIVIKSLEVSAMQELVRELQKRNIQSVAIAFLNSYKNPVHEILLTKALRDEGFNFVSASHSLSPQIKILPRAETAVANAYLDPIIRSYVTGIQKVLSGASINMMTSAGSLVNSNSFFPKDSLLSGPAGGVVGAAYQASRSGVKKIIAFDMGGTSTDVSLYNGHFDYRFESKVGSFKILSPALAIETIAAGGGSICDFDGHRFTVGPHSAGAFPGPACYGAGGPLTITDVNVLLGRIDPENFAIPIQIRHSEQALTSLLQKLPRKAGSAQTREGVLKSLILIANEMMAEAIRKISVQQGHDPKEFALLSFGGAGGQHACSLARILGMNRVIVPYDAGLLSALGIGHAAIENFQEKQILQLWKGFEPHLGATLVKLFDDAKSNLISEGFSEKDISWKDSLLYLRFTGQDSSIEVEYRAGKNIPLSFRKKYKSIFGHWTDRDIQVEMVRVIAVVKRPTSTLRSRAFKSYTPVTLKTVRTISEGKFKKSQVYRWEDLNRGATIAGPALIVSGNSTTFVEPHWTWKLDDQGNAHLTESKKLRVASDHSKEAHLELFTNRFTALAQEMGALLQRTSFSVNVKERLDFSCAVLDAGGYLVVNAPHIPVHLGSLGVCVREVMKAIEIREGDVIITNHPAYGGSHLPDVTLIKPVFYKKSLVGYVANRAHHAEIGGTKPGSMPADARTLVEEGVIIAPTYLVRKGIPQWANVKKILSTGTYPTRALDENLADLNGGLAAVNLGERGLAELCEQFGKREVSHYMKELRTYAASLLREKIRSLRKGNMRATEQLDDGSILNVVILRQKDRLKIDFTGSSPVHSGNLNATSAIVQSVVLYSLRLLVNQPLPMNEGLMEPVDLVLPIGLLNPDFQKGELPAVVGGNTEVSQRLTDTMLKAFELAACSQGTMNNFLFGNDRFGYYETICGGTGAGQGFDGADAVHQHMTNTRITDPELLEFRYPVLLNRFEIRKDSGGKGEWKGGEGTEREILFRENLEINILSQHRKAEPYGMNGGGSGKIGEQMILRRDGRIEKMKGMDSAQVNSGDRLIIKTPGGGGWGSSDGSVTSS